MGDLRNIRREYTLHELDEKSVQQNPFEQFSLWINDALTAEEPEATAMVLSTVSEENKPSSRIVLLKSYTDEGLDFFTNFNSKKGKHIQNNPFASLLFFWPKMERQIRIEGKIEKISSKESDQYFNERPKESQIAAWASPQSEVVQNRKTLKDWYETMEEIHLNKKIKRPPHWGGFRLKPNLFEFWQGRRNRLHDRLEYILEKPNWVIRRIAP
jgi:pyridoxamine 5'-phosphate oxidase